MEQTETRTMHTPGPEVYDWDEDGEGCYRLLVNTREPYVRGQVPKTAALLDAAPDLAAACRDMDENWHLIHDGLKRVFADHNNPNYQTLVRVINEMQDAARAALAKAGLK